ncbi:hypothetical protein B0H63DRAFT_509638 [Podospora didyma]|uniref:Ecp2 effector protein domain-containing protein n=1 Tax=Podospora didyma TaxID=330526 RepID=A0AAE0U1W4_9PEZI|nr:hypothetical protein B0H63DRAFT_509638 [Podospora didyma]
MLSIRSILAALSLVAAVLAAPSPAPAPFITNATAHDVRDLALADRSAAIDPNGQSRVILCNDAFHGGQCLNWGQKGHCWDMNDPNLAPFDNAISSFYPQDQGVVWVLWENRGCSGASLQVVAPGIDNLADFGFNDRASGFSWFLR